jgi:hypothetical protein
MSHGQCFARTACLLGLTLTSACAIEPNPAFQDSSDATSASEGPSTSGSTVSSGDDPATGLVEDGSDAGGDAGTGTDGSSCPGECESDTGAGGRIEDGLVVLYTFEEGDGAVIFDRAQLRPPIDLFLSEEGFTWEDAGLVSDGGIGSSNAVPTRVLDACQLTNEITLEAWLTPAQAVAPLEARIVTNSAGYDQRNFMLAQAREVEGWAVRLRTTQTDENGLPEFQLHIPILSTLTHLVYTRAASGEERMYVDGELEATATRSGDFSSWSPSYSLYLANEVGDHRGWRGTMHLVAIYDRALDPSEVGQNFESPP